MAILADFPTAALVRVGVLVLLAGAGLSVGLLVKHAFERAATAEIRETLARETANASSRAARDAVEARRDAEASNARLRAAYRRTDRALNRARSEISSASSDEDCATVLRMRLCDRVDRGLRELEPADPDRDAQDLPARESGRAAGTADSPRQ